MTDDILDRADTHVKRDEYLYGLLHAGEMNQTEHETKLKEPNRMKMNELFPSRFVSAEDVGEGLNVQIARVSFESMKDNKGKDEEKPVLHFRGNTKPMVLNKTNGSRIEELYGDETDNWIGKPLTLIAEQVDAFGKTKWAVRVKLAPPARKPMPTAPKPAAAQYQPADQDGHNVGGDVGF